MSKYRAQSRMHDAVRYLEACLLIAGEKRIVRGHEPWLLMQDWELEGSEMQE